MVRYLLLLIIFITTYSSVEASLYCYRCVSSQPGCGENFEWLWHWSKRCMDPTDICVKIIERKGTTTMITRDCLSTFEGIRTDTPADHYEGCRSASVDVKLANYVFNDELDIDRRYYDETTWCFCSFDNRCNSTSRTHVITFLVYVALLLLNL